MKVTHIKQPFDPLNGGLGGSQKKKITAIRRQVKRPDRYSVYVDGRFAFGLSEAGLLSSGLHVGQEFDQKQLDSLKDTAKIDKAYNQVLGLIARRQRSRWEIEQYLYHKNLHSKGNPWNEGKDDIISFSVRIVEKLEARGYLDDKKFAQAWVENRRLLKPVSRRRLTQELRAKHIDGDTIDEVLSQDETDEQAVLRDLITRKQKHYPDKLKFMQYLARQGFSYDDIKAVLDQSAEEE